MNWLDGYGNKQWRHEKSHQPWEVKGSYGYKDKHGIMREVDYVADKHGFRAHVRTNEPGTAPKDPASVKFDAHPVQTPGHHYQSNYGGGHGHGHSEHGGGHSEHGGGHQSYDHGHGQGSHQVHHYDHNYASSLPQFAFIPIRKFN